MYQVSYSGRVKQHLRELVARNPAHRAEIGRVLKDIDRLFRVYPQFGEPLRDLDPPDARLWLATVPPLVAHYIVVEPDDGRPRHVTVVRPFMTLPNSGLV